MTVVAVRIFARLSCLACCFLALALPAAAASYQDYLLSLPGLTSHWGMAETSGNTVADSVTNDLVDGNNPGSFALGGGASLNVAGPRPGNGFAGFSPTNSAIHFNGTAGQRLDMSPAGYTGPDGLATASMATWFRLTAPANNNEHNFLGGLQLEADGASDRYGLAMNSYPQSNPNSSNSGQRGGLRAFVRVGNNPQSNVSTYGTSYTSSSGDTSFWDSQWHFGVTTFDRYGSNGRVLKLYVDGGLVRRVSEGNLANLPDGPDTTLAARDALVFGQDAADSSRLWQGQLDEISMFSRSLTGAEVGNAYMAAKGITTNHALLPTRGLSAHRGQSTTHPENTIAALKAAVDAGAHQVEFDVQLTQDNKLILMHDTETIERTTGVAGRVQDFTLSQLKALDAGSWKDATFAGERIPTLEEALEVLPLNMWLNVEIKGIDGNEGATAAMAAAVLHAKGRLHQSFIAGSGGTRAAVAAYESQAGVDIRFNNLDREGGVTSAYVAATINHGDDFIQLRYNHPEATPQQIQALKNAGVQINYHYTNDPSRVSGLYDRGIDFVQADDVEMMMGAAIAEGVVPLLPLYRGDFNQDGQVDSRDFDPFFSALIDPSGFAADNPDFDVDIYGDFSLSGEFGLEDYEGFHLAVTGGATLAGDFNLDGKVDQDDYQVWKSAFGLAHATSLVPADANGDGVVDAADYTVWRNNLGASAPGALLAVNPAAVPEPRGLVLVLLATAGFAFYASAKRVELQSL